MGMKMKFRSNQRVLSGREARRYGERERKREEREKDVQAFWALSPEERAQRMRDNEIFRRISRNGITLDDLKYAEDEGYKRGFNAGIENTMRTCYAAICLALNELHGFGSERCRRVLNNVDDKVVMALTSDDVIQEVFDRMGLKIDFHAGPLEERIERD